MNKKITLHQELRKMLNVSKEEPLSVQKVN